MHDPRLTIEVVMHTIVATIRRVVPDHDRDPDTRDRGAVSLEQALWYAAAAISVAVVAGLIWNAIRTEASKPVAPAGL